ncbi:hypothetical protein K432DRAFT_60968 [Lepidopterella palustris CBS 459.81]|uniref:2EXR domain-containing protein n=1 Tax=Lepidopterella palustris CBS 459.81 TaxID=1314670 RepID=A0A8E2EKH4_9PEZI|nr:hypothetical protein K432DRAFT_60968 [Lepidopterella palustris CBS 459.81]
MKLRPRSYFQFQQLPFEPRIMVYSYLVPDKVMPSFRPINAQNHRSRSNYSSLKHNGESHPAILGTSKDIYTEAVVELDKNAVLQIIVNTDRNTLFNRQREIYDDNSFSNTQHIKTNHILLRFYRLAYTGIRHAVPASSF